MLETKIYNVIILCFVKFDVGSDLKSGFVAK